MLNIKKIVLPITSIQLQEMQLIPAAIILKFSTDLEEKLKY